MEESQVESALSAATGDIGMEAIGPVLESYRGRIERMLREKLLQTRVEDSQDQAGCMRNVNHWTSAASPARALHAPFPIVTS